MGDSSKRRELRASRQSAGLCIYCGENTPKENTKGCEPCLKHNSEINSKFSKRHPDKQIEYRNKVKDFVIEKYGGCCDCCGESERVFLTIDHINDDGGEERRDLYGTNAGSAYQWYLKLKREDKREDLRVLCFNCNCGRRINGGVCPHEKIDQKNIPNRGNDS